MLTWGARLSLWRAWAGLGGESEGVRTPKGAGEKRGCWGGQSRWGTSVRVG
jgi:hypothetical protein